MSKKIGFLVAATKTTWQKYIKAFEHELTHNKGWTIGSGTGPKDVFIDYEPQTDANGNAIDGAAGDLGLIQQTAALFADPKSKCDVIVTAGTAAAQACQSATKTKSIVFASAGDPVGCGLVKSLQAPTGTNLTGCHNMQTDQGVMVTRIGGAQNLKTDAKKKIGVIGNDNPTVCPIDSALSLAWKNVPANTAVLIKLQPTDFQSRQSIQAALTQYQNDVDVLLVCSDPLVSANVAYLIQAAHNLGMKTMHEFREPKEDHGGDGYYGPSFKDLFIMAADMVDQILSGSKSAGDIDVYQPTIFEEELKSHAGRK
jgi:putative tryptophan/tyrosine transport system substrate-binding protein